MGKFTAVPYVQPSLGILKARREGSCSLCKCYHAGYSSWTRTARDRGPIERDPVPSYSLHNRDNRGAIQVMVRARRSTFLEASASIIASREIRILLIIEITVKRVAV